MDERRSAVVRRTWTENAYGLTEGLDERPQAGLSLRVVAGIIGYEAGRAALSGNHSQVGQTIRTNLRQERANGHGQP